jgi:hypothetical protein
VGHGVPNIKTWDRKSTSKNKFNPPCPAVIFKILSHNQKSFEEAGKIASINALYLATIR